MANSVVFPRAQFFSNSGRPLVGGRIHTYVAGSSTRARTYQDAANVQINTNPIILDARGEAAIYLAEGVEYKFVVEDSTGALIMTQEPVYGAIWPNAAEWPSDATLSYQYMTEAYQYMTEAKAAAGAIGPIKFYDTKAQADAAIGTMANGDIIEVSQDETRAGARTRYKAQAGALVFAVNLDQLRLDLAEPGGAGLVGYDDSTAQAVLDDAKPMANYTGMRAYTGRATGIRTTSAGIAGFFARSTTDTTSADNGGMIIVDASGRRWLRLFVGEINVKWFGATGNGVTDDTAAITAAIAYIAAVTPWPTSTSRATNRPALYFPAGVYPVSATLAVSFSAFSVRGDGRANTVIAWSAATDAPVFDIGTFSATPANIFVGPQDTTLTGLRIQHANPGVMGARLGQGIRCSGGGGLRLRDVAVLGFKVGINCPYGGDFNEYKNVDAEYCDVGVYQGPGGQQFNTEKLHVFGCVDGLVMDRPGQVHMVMPIISNCRDNGIKLESTGGTTTRFLTVLPASGISYQSKIVLDSPWFEGNAGNMGADYTTTHFISNENAGTDAYRDIEVRDPIILAGQSTKMTTSLFSNTSGLAAQRVVIRRPVFSGVMTYWLNNPGARMLLEDARVTTGYAAPAYANGSDYMTREVNGLTERYGILPVLKTVETGAGTQGIQTSYGSNGILRFGFMNAGSYLYRFGVDIQGRRLFLGDPALDEFSVSRGSAMPATGTYAIGSFVYNIAPTVSGGKTLLGWQRLTTGSAHVAGTDWTPCYVATT